MNSRARVSRHPLFLLAIWLVLIIGIFAPSFVRANPLLLADAKTGEVLFERDATMPWYPASLTKMMTAYVAFREVRAGHIAFDTLIPITHRALSVETTRSGAQWGQSITLDGALKFMLVQSANDMAITVAEGVGGRVEDFVALMNKAAKEIGLKETQFSNPNGLYAPDQFTSARDLAVLTRQIITEFPDYKSYFSISGLDAETGFRGNTNGLVGRYPGADGMKTGFICPSGFNLVGTATRDGRQLIAIVLGTESGAMRVARSARLLDYGFADRPSTGKTLADLPSSKITTPPDLRMKICGGQTVERSLDDMPLPSKVTPLGERSYADLQRVRFGATSRTAYAPQARNFGMPDLPVSALPSIVANGKAKQKDPRAIVTASINQDERDQTEPSTFGMESRMLTGGIQIGIPGFFQ